MATLKAIRSRLEQEKPRSAWNKGVLTYAWELFDNIEQHENWLGLNDETDYAPLSLQHYMLNGAENWHEYSWGGCSLIYDMDIAKTLCNASELKRTNSGRRRPNSREQWLDVQARALSQAAFLIVKICWAIDKSK